MGHDVLLTWVYPRPSDLKYGWITLVYELQYRQVSEPGKWKVKQSLREPQVELLGLPVNDYVLRVRCRSLNYGLWSNWSQPLLMSIPSRAPAADKLWVLILVMSISMVALLAIAMCVIPQCSRVKDFFWPQIPKPRIIGIDQLLLKKGNLEEINRHFHSNIAPFFIDTNIWEPVTPDSIYLTSSKDCTIPIETPNQVTDTFGATHDLTPTAALHQHGSQPPSPFRQSPYCTSPLQDFPSSLWPNIISMPEDMMGQPSPPPAAPSTSCPPQDLYSGAQLMNHSDGLQVVSCPPLPYCELPPLPKSNFHGDVEDEEKLAEYQAK
ncbi:growth hormone receptor-like [Syngnathus typhle]